MSVDLVRAPEDGDGSVRADVRVLDAERLGVAREIYTDRLYSARRKEARELGLSVNDVGEDPVDLDLGDRLKAARDVSAA